MDVVLTAQSSPLVEISNSHDTRPKAWENEAQIRVTRWQHMERVERVAARTSDHHHGTTTVPFHVDDSSLNRHTKSNKNPTDQTNDCYHMTSMYVCVCVARLCVYEHKRLK